MVVAGGTTVLASDCGCGGTVLPMSSSEPVVDVWSSEQVITCRDDAAGLRAVIAIDDSTLGPGFGGVRRRAYPSTDAAIAEAQRLAAAMTLKHAVAELPYGGAKSVIIDDGSADDRRLIAAFGRFVARTGGTYIPGVDMGTTLADMQLIREQGATAYCADENPSPWTARGVYAAMRAAVAHRLDADTMKGVRVVVQGVGSVGASLARSIAADGGTVTVADVDAGRAAALADELGGDVVDPDEAPFTDCDVFAPCAVARVIRMDTIGRLRCRVVAGAANDTLDTPECGPALAERGITFVPDFVANACGVIQVHGLEEGWDHDRLVAEVERIGTRVGEILTDASAGAITPLAAALQRAADRLAAARTTETKG